MSKPESQSKFEKKTERLDVRLSNEKKQAFTEACENQGDTPSQAVRRFISSYIRRSNRDDRRATFRTPLFRKRLAISGAVAAVVMAGVAALAWQHFMSTGMKAHELFAYYDVNENGLLDLKEISANDHHLHRVLNIDGKPGISADEFITHGTMVWRMVDPEQRVVVENKRTAKKHVRRIRSKMSDLPEGALIPTGNPDKPFLTVDEFIALDQPISEIQKNLKFDPRKIRRNEIEVPPPHANHFVMFDLRTPTSIRVDVLEQKSSSLHSKSLVFSRSVEWEENGPAPHYVMGRGSKDWEKMMAAETSRLN